MLPLSNCYAFDIDGTLADNRHRLHYLQRKPKDWDGWYSECHLDAPHQHIVTLAQTLQVTSKLIYVTARRESVWRATCEWLDALGLYGMLYMRLDGDRRDDALVKADLIQRVLNDGFRPTLAFDDRDRSVAVWRAHGIPCAQVAPGNF